MASHTRYIYILAVIIFFISLMGFYWAQKFRKMDRTIIIFGWSFSTSRVFQIFESFACGTFLAISLVHLFPNAIKTSFGQKSNGVVVLSLIMAVSFIFFLFIDHLPNFISHKYNHKTSIIVLIFSWLGLIIHSFFMGISLSIVSNHFWVIFAFFIGIIAHKFFVSFSLTIQFVKNPTITPTKTLILMCLFSLSTPLGIILGNGIAFDNTALAIILVISAGILLYVGTLHGLGEAVLIRKCCYWKNFVSMFIGFAILAGLAFVS